MTSSRGLASTAHTKRLLLSIWPCRERGKRDHQLFNSRNFPRNEFPSSQHNGQQLTHTKAYSHEEQNTEATLPGPVRERRKENGLQKSHQQQQKLRANGAVTSRC